jgi:hypothetical protein
VTRDTRRRVRVAVLVAGVALAALLVGCLLPVIDSDSSENLGEVDGIAYDESLSLTVEDGLNESELDALVARSMARVEVIRGLTFEERVEVDVIAREEYREQRNTNTSNATRVWENLRYEALFVVGQDRDASTVLDEGFAGNVQGYYSLRDDEIVIVSDADQPTVDKNTLVHELVHALQDQRFGIEYNAQTTDANRGYESVVEGPAELVERLYFQRCDTEWSCVRPGDTAGSSDLEPGIELQILLPYVEGRAFVDTVRRQDGWGAVDELHEQPPESSAQVIHPEKYPDTEPANVTVTDRSTEAWSRLGASDIARRLGVGGDKRNADTLGEAAIYAMLVDNNVIDPEERLSYEHSFSAGWAGDQLVAYRNETELGYVWETAWETRDDADQFASAYRQILQDNGALGTGDGVFVIPDGPFEGAFRLTQEGSTVRIVNAPTGDTLDEIHR